MVTPFYGSFDGPTPATVFHDVDAGANEDAWDLCDNPPASITSQPPESLAADGTLSLAAAIRSRRKAQVRPRPAYPVQESFWIRRARSASSPVTLFPASWVDSRIVTLL